MLLNINIDKLTKLIESFYKLTKIKITLYDDAFNRIFTYPEKESKFCDMLNQNPDVYSRCQESAKVLCQRCREQNRLVTHTCHAGMTETVAPLSENGLTIGYIMFGQITNIKNKTEFADKARELCADYGLDDAEFDEKIRTVPYKTNEQIEAVSEIINAITNYIHLQKIVALKEEDKIFAITDYIKNNLASDLSVPVLCEHFSISKTVLYQLTKHSMPEGIAKYVRNSRLEYAKHLIKSTDKSIEEISGMAGFLDSNYFRRLFKQVYGMPANIYRKSL